jgi:NAD(P)H-dependent FMN reductase
MKTISHDRPNTTGTLFADRAPQTATRITVISGTNRLGSATRRVTEVVASLYTALQQEVRILDLAELPLEAFAPSAYSRKPDTLHRFVAPVLEADGIHFVTPEYNGGAPGVLKHFIDLLPYPQAFEDRPVCFTGLAAGQWGALRPVEQLQLILSYGKALLFPERVFLPKIGTTTSHGGSIVDAEGQERLRQQTRKFVAFVHRVSVDVAPGRSPSS